MGGQGLRRPPVHVRFVKAKEVDMAEGQQRGNREAEKPKKEKIKVIAAAPSQKAQAWQPTLTSDKKK